MAAVFLVTLYEYSPLFYISVVSLCFVITAAMVLGWFGFDVPVILRSADETESLLPTPEKQMVQMTNPFILEMGSGPASVTDGVSVRPRCLEPCVLNCFWGCEVSALQGVLQAHQHGLLLSTSQYFQEALHLHYHHYQSFRISSEDTVEYHTQIPADQGIRDFGPLPREHYPLVVVLTLAEPDARDSYNIFQSYAKLPHLKLWASSPDGGARAAVYSWKLCNVITNQSYMPQLCSVHQNIAQIMQKFSDTLTWQEL